MAFTGGRRVLAAAGCALVASMLLGATPASAATPDPVAPGVPGGGRAWELVTSPEPVLARLGFGQFGGGPENLLLAISPSGDRIAYKTASPLPDGPFGAFVNFNLAERGPAGWSDRTLPYPQAETASMILTFLSIEGPLAFNADLTKSLWLNSLGARADEFPDNQIFSGSPGPPYAPTVHMGYESGFSAASPDLGTVVFSSAEHLVPADAVRTAGQSIYEYDGSGIHLVDVKDDGSLIDACGSSLAGTSLVHDEVLFTPEFSCGANSHLYMRKGGHTVDVAASQCTLADCGPEATPSLLGLSSDGSTVFFVSAQRLTDADNEGKEMIYRYDVASGTLSQLYQQPPGGAVYVLGGYSRRVLSSDDGSRVYFCDLGQLLPGQGAENGLNLYMADAGGLHFLASVANDPLVSADGRYAVFSTPEALDPADTDASADVYRYDADSGDSTLVSAGTGGRGDGAFDASARGLKPIDDDHRVVFSTAEPLLPQDRNDKEDLYEWSEADGLALVSGGVPGLPGEFVGATPDGGTVLFRTGATLLPRDRDGGDLDIYAARIGGGLPEPAEPAQPGCSECGGSASAGGSPRPSPLGKPDLRQRLELGPIADAARRQLARTGATTLLVEAPTPGRLTIVGRDPDHRPVAGGSAKARDAGPLRVRLRLDPAASHALAHGKGVIMRLHLSLGHAQVRGPALTLKPAAHS